MNQLTPAMTQGYEPQFDVFVSWNKVTPLEEIKDLAQRLNGMPPDKANALVNALSNSATVCIGKGATRERADSAKISMSRIGLAVELRPSLSLEVDIGMSSYKCPACDERVALPQNRQCPKCGVFVDKVDDEFLRLKKQIDEQNRPQKKVALSAAENKKDGKAGETVEAPPLAQEDFLDYLPSNGVLAGLLVVSSLFLLNTIPTVFSIFPRFVQNFLNSSLHYIEIISISLALLAVLRLARNRLARVGHLLLVALIFADLGLQLFAIQTPLWDTYIFSIAFVVLSLGVAIGVIQIQATSNSRGIEMTDRSGSLGDGPTRFLQAAIFIVFTFVVINTGVKVQRHQAKFEEYKKVIRQDEKQVQIQRATGR